MDGLGDLPHKLLNNKTPLEAAVTPNLDYLANFGKLGFLHPVKEGYVPESDTAILSILGNKFQGSFRGYLEALGSLSKVNKGDLCIRTNFATIDNLKNKHVKDRRAGRTLSSKESEVLEKAINKNIKLPVEFNFKSTVQHRGVLIFKGGFSDNITNVDPEYSKTHKKLVFSHPQDDEDKIAKYTSNIINEFVEQSFRVLNEHPINKERKKKGLMPANIILTRDASTNPPKLNKFRKWASVVNMPLELGISKASNINPFSFPYPEMKGCDVYQNLYTGLTHNCKFSVKTLKKQAKNFNYFYLHFKETDVPGHDNKPLEKKAMIELIDKKFFYYLKKLQKKKIKILITADHSTPCNLKKHSADPVPVLLIDWEKSEEKRFTEKSCKKGKLGKIKPKEIIGLLK